MAKTELTVKEPVKKRFSRFRLPYKRIAPLTPGWKGAFIALTFITLCVYFVQGYYLLGTLGPFDYLTGTILFLLAIILITGVIAGLFHWTKKMPSRYVWLMLASFCLLVISFIGPMQLMFLVTLSVIIAFSLLGSFIYRWITGAYREAKRISKVTASVIAAVTFGYVCIAGYWLLGDGNAELPKPYRLQAIKPADRYQTTMANPAEQGAFKVKTLTYGSENSYRKEFNAEGSLITKQVDGSSFVDNWSSMRTRTFGFGPDAMPLNGLVWYPEGEGPFPLVVTVHGNHLATDYSDPGYEYLGELLASRGYIFVSIDQNFLNTSPYDDLFIVKVLKNENRARGWLMLEHLKAWEEWNTTKGSPFYGKADMSKIALIGHSRGGEAATVAAAYNKLPTSPENGNIKFDYNFGIRSVISIAGTDGQYKPAGQSTELKDVNYLAIQGVHDMDVSSFDGASQYSRVGFTDGSDYFKASVYMYGANHGQFNTEWGETDGAGLGNKLFNIAQLIPQEEQLQAAKVLISSFLDTTLKGSDEYRTVFQDLGNAREWLPDTMYISNYMDANTTIISSFDEDIDLSTTTFAGGRLIGEGLKIWQEEKVKMKYMTDQYSTVRLGWDHASASSVPEYSMILPNDGLHVSDHSSIVFSMANGDKEIEASGTNALVDLTVKAEDKDGNIAALPLSSEASLLPMLEGNIVKWPFTSSMPTKEPVFQNFDFKLSDLKKINPNFAPEQLSKISFVFDQTETGTILVRDIGIRNNTAITGQ